MNEQRELQARLDELDASIVVLERIERPSGRARADLEALRVRRTQVAEALAATRGHGAR